MDKEQTFSFLGTKIIFYPNNYINIYFAYDH